MASTISFDTYTESLGYAGGAAGDLFGAVGNFQAAGSYKASAKSLRTNATLEEESLRIKQAQLQRQTYGILGGQKMDIAAAGFSNGGSALDIIRDTATQGALAKGQLATQGAISINTYKGQAEAADSQAASEQVAGVGNIIGSVFQIGAALLPFVLSDRRAKHNIERIGTTKNGLPWYSFNYRGGSTRMVGLMSDDVRKFRPEAVIVGPDGLDRVNYALALA